MRTISNDELRKFRTKHIVVVDYVPNHRSAAKLSTPFTSWYLLAENQGKEELQDSELKLAEELAYRDNELRELRKSPNRSDRSCWAMNQVLP
jgi:hypothetical protein